MKKIILFLGLLVLAGCASYRAAPLNTISEGSYWLPWKKNDVVVAARAFDHHDCKRYLDRDVIGEGYCPVQITIENRSDHPYLFSLNRVTLPCARVDEVAERVHTSTVGRAAGYGAAALFFWPFAIPAVVDGVCSSQANEALDLDFAEKVAKDQIVEPYAHVNMLMFVPEQAFQDVFTVTLLDEYNRPRDFVVRTALR